MDGLGLTDKVRHREDNVSILKKERYNKQKIS